MLQIDAALEKLPLMWLIAKTKISLPTGAETGYNESMTMHVEIPDDVAELVEKQAAATGAAPEAVAIRAMRATLLSDERLTETLRPVREAFARSGMTEDEAVELFEQEKHAMRRGE